jgi:hypothetical protein
VEADLAAGVQRVEHRPGVLAAAHGQGQLCVSGVRYGAAGWVGAGKPVHRVESHVCGQVGGADGEVEDAAAADRRELVAVTEQRDAHLALVGDGEQGAGGVLVEHAGLVHDEEVSGEQPRLLGRPGVDGARGRVGLPTLLRVDSPSPAGRASTCAGAATARMTVADADASSALVGDAAVGHIG